MSLQDWTGWDWQSLLDRSAQLLEFLLLLTALRITLTSSIDGIINTYRGQSLILAAVTALNAGIELKKKNSFGPEAQLVILVIAVLPLLLAILAKPLLLRATRSAASSPKGKQPMMFLLRLPFRDSNFREAKQVWRDASEQSVRVRALDAVAFIAIVALAAYVATWFNSKPGGKSIRLIGLTVSLSLHFVGLYIMTSKRDLISQTVGLLVMDHGLYLGLVNIVTVPVPAIFFAVALFCYTAITFVILYVMVPQVRFVEGTIDLNKVARDSALKG